MRILRSIEELSSVPGPIHLAIGVFDGVHLGHQEVIRRSHDAAESQGGSPVVLTFDPHPARVLRPESAPRLLTSIEHKQLILERLGVPYLAIIPFDLSTAAQKPEAFIHQLCEASHGLTSIAVGKDWAFGKGRAGNVTLLNLLGAKEGFVVHPVSPVKLDGEAISSTRVRSAIERGDFGQAEKLLGRPYTVLGTVVHGRHLGRELGFPTANLTLQNEQLPPLGVYAVRALLHGHVLQGVANLGTRPTVDSEMAERVLEVHLLDHSEDIYDEEMEVRFIRRLREERRFQSLDELKAQIALDVEATRELFSPHYPLGI